VSYELTAEKEDYDMTDLQEFASSSNGDKWFFGKDAATSRLFVLHRGNASSGGHETRSSVDAFLNQQPFGPEREALVVFLEKNKTSEDTGIREDAETPSLRLAEEYLRLGGRRRVKVDDKIVSTRKWDDEPAMASSFWKEHIEPLDEKQRREVKLHLPSISDI
jgi:hypothetical protein